MLGLDLAPSVAALAVVVAILVSAASYRWVETPFIRPGYPKLPYLAVGSAMIVVFCGIGIAGHALKGLPMRFSPEARALFAAADDANPQRLKCHNGPLAEIPYARNCVFGPAGAPADVVVWGDSHGAELSYALGEVAGSAGHRVMEVTASSCPPAINLPRKGRPNCEIHNQKTLNAILADSNVKTVVLVAYYQNVRRDRNFDAGFEAIVQKLRAEDKTVVLVMPAPMYDFEIPSRLGKLWDLGGDVGSVGMPRSDFDASVEDARRFLEDISARYDLRTFDPAPLFCNDSFCRTWAPEIGVLYFNRNHISLTAARQLSPGLLPLLEAAPGSAHAAN